MIIEQNLTPAALQTRISKMWDISRQKILSTEESAAALQGSPVFTIKGRYQSQGWTEWTQGFQYGSAILQFDATNEESFLEMGRSRTMQRMAVHLTHTGVHDHGFNNVSTYGNLRRLTLEGRIPRQQTELDYYELALKVSGAVQAGRWSRTSEDDGYIYSFNGPHSLFCDTIRSLRALALAHQLGHLLQAENDVVVNLLDRLLQHARTTARYNVYYGQDRDAYDLRGRVAHESIFNCNDGRYRCPSTQQGYSPFSTWTRGLAWIITGYAEQLEWLQTRAEQELAEFGGHQPIEETMLDAATAAADFYLENTPEDGVPYWDTGAPGLARLGDYLRRPSDPGNPCEPVDSSAAAIACQGLMRLGRYLMRKKQSPAGRRYFQAGLTVLQALLEEPYLAVDPNHQGLLLHSIYHRPRQWDYVPDGSKIPNGESSMWGDYHLREAALYVERLDKQENLYYTFFGPRNSK